MDMRPVGSQLATFLSIILRLLTFVNAECCQMKTGKKSHAFKSMPSVQRRVIHELAEF